MSNFGNIQLSDYRPAHRAMPVQEFSASMSHLEKRYDQNLMASESLREHVDALKVENHNKDILDGAASNLYGTLTTLVDSGDLEYAEKDLLKAARDFKSTPLLKESLEDYGAYVAWEKDIAERELDIKDPDRIAKHRYIYQRDAKQLSYDENGKVINRFNMSKPVNTVDIAGQALEFLKEWQPDKVIGADIGNPTTERSQMQLSTTGKRVAGYIPFLSTEYKDKAEMTSAAIDHILSKPENVAYIREMLTLENNVSRDIPIEDRLANIGIGSYEVLSSMTKQGVAKEEVFDENLLNYQKELDALRVRGSKIKSTDTKAIEKYEKDAAELAEAIRVASDARLESIVDSEQYGTQLQGMFNAKYQVGLIEKAISSAVASQDQVIQNVDWKQDWIFKMQIEDAREKKKVEEAFALNVGAAPSQTVQSLILSVNGEGWKMALDTNKELGILRPIPKEERTPQQIAALEEAELRMKNFKASISQLEKQLVNTGEVDQAQIDLAYNTYVKEGGKDSKEWYLARVINDRGNITSNKGFVVNRSSSVGVSGGSSIAITDPFAYSSRVVGSSGGIERRFDKALAKLSKDKHAQFTMVYNPLRPIDGQQAPVLANINNALNTAAINGELNSIDDNMPLHQKIRQMAKNGLVTINGNQVGEITGFQFNTEMSMQRMPNGRVGATVTVMNKAGTAFLQDSAGNPLRIQVYAPDNIQSGHNLEEMYANVIDASLKSASPTTRMVGETMIAESSLIQHLNTSHIIPETMNYGEIKTFNIGQQQFNLQRNKDTKTWDILDIENRPLTFFNGVQQQLLSSPHLNQLGLQFAQAQENQQRR